MRLRLLIIFIVTYILVSFGWLTYSLINFSNHEYTLQRQVLEAGKQACVLKLIETSQNGGFDSDQAVELGFKQATVAADTFKLRNFLNNFYKGSYDAVYVTNEGKLMLDIVIAPAKIESLDNKLYRRKRIYFFQALLLTVLVGIGVYGVSYSLRMIYRLNKQQNNFLLSVTHELKTPIAAMKLMLQTIRTRKLPDEKRNELLEKAINNSDRLNELAENMLTAMQIESDNYDYGEEEFSLTEMIERLAESYRMRTELSVDIEENVFLKGDRFILRICFNNLLENAIKYGDNQPVELAMFTLNNKAIVEVRDGGIGISDEERKQIFKKFYRVEDEEVRDTKGTGLGLFIVKESIEKHGGTIRNYANNPRGTVFRVSLPLSKK